MKSNALLKKISLVLVAGVISLAAFTGCSNKTDQTTQTEKETATTSTGEKKLHAEGVTAEDALNALIEGNKRFVSGNLSEKDLSKDVLVDLSQNGQHPFATIITCSDSRVAPELLFDQGLGDLFIIRDAGNVAGAIETASVEYAVEHLECPLVVVLGHEKCGAVKASMEGGEVTPNLEEIVNKIKPSIDKVKAENKDAAEEEIAAEVEEENAKATVNELLKSPTIKELVDSGKVKIVAARYHIESGEVEILE
jgi:carbonic anhydrase